MNEQWTNKKNVQHKQTDWFDVEVWGPKTRTAALLKKGTPVMLAGKVRTGILTTREGTQQKTWTITANMIRRIDYTQLSETVSDASEESE